MGHGPFAAPVPPANRSPKGPGAPRDSTASSVKTDAPAPNPDKQAEPGNSKVNTTHQGHQQDR